MITTLSTYSKSPNGLFASKAPAPPTDSFPVDGFQKSWRSLEAFANSSIGRLSHLFSTPQAPPGMELDITNDIKWDGHLLGADKSSESGESDNIEPVRPNNGKTPDETVFLVNGIMTDVKLQRSDMQSLANTGKDVIGVHNATAGLLYDLAQCLDDKADTQFSDNKATTSTIKLIVDSLEKKKPLHLVGHSQGALIISNAAATVRDGLLAKGLSIEEAEAQLQDVTITTFGGAAQNYPDGPKYTHVINQSDVVPMGTGLGMIGGHPGKDAVLHPIDVTKEPQQLPDRRLSLQNWMARYVDRTTHGPQDIYFNHAPWLEEHPGDEQALA